MIGRLFASGIWGGGGGGEGRGLILGRAYFWEGLLSEFYGITGPKFVTVEPMTHGSSSFNTSYCSIRYYMMFELVGVMT